MRKTSKSWLIRRPSPIRERRRIIMAAAPVAAVGHDYLAVYIRRKANRPAEIIL